MVKFMRAMNTVLQRGDFVLIYPEESLWPGYKKPKPLKNGAFYFAVKNNVPIIPIFITMEGSGVKDENGNEIPDYTINIGKSISQNADKTSKENIEEMKNQNYDFCKKVYEDFYKTSLIYEKQ